MARILKTFSLPPEDETTWQAFIKIIEKDGSVTIAGKDMPAKSASAALMEFIRFTVKAHSDNPTPGLKRWVADPDYLALPTLGEEPTYERVKKMTNEDRKLVRRSAMKWIKKIDGVDTVPAERPTQVYVGNTGKKEFVPSQKCAKCGLPMVYLAEVHYDSHPECKPDGWKASPKTGEKLLAGITGREGPTL